uniref:Uncharacterized protein n=1 Tax=Salix viminalis TaxID=40686 RepID=A0A6N2K4R2_SALVM
MAPAIYRPQKTGWHGRERLFVTLSLLRCHSIELHFLFHLSRLNSFTHCSFSLYVQENHFLLASRPAHNTTRSPLDIDPKPAVPVRTPSHLSPSQDLPPLPKYM